MKTLLYTIFFSLFGIHLLAQSNKAVCLDGKDNNLRIGMDTLCRHWKHGLNLIIMNGSRRK